MIYAGYVYCFSNKSMPDILKIGMTERTPEIRSQKANDSDTWIPPTPYKNELAKKVTNPKQKETIIHEILGSKRIHPKREFFRVTIDQVRLLFKLMDGDDWIDKKWFEVPNEKLLHEKKEESIGDQKEESIGEEEYKQIIPEKKKRFRTNANNNKSNKKCRRLEDFYKVDYWYDELKSNSQPLFNIGV